MILQFTVWTQGPSAKADQFKESGIVVTLHDAFGQAATAALRHPGLKTFIAVDGVTAYEFSADKDGAISFCNLNEKARRLARGAAKV